MVAGGGRRIEDYYDIREEIGRGTCGRVHVALHRKTGEAWAVKVNEDHLNMRGRACVHLHLSTVPYLPPIPTHTRARLT